MGKGWARDGQGMVVMEVFPDFFASSVFSLSIFCPYTLKKNINGIWWRSSSGLDG